MIARRSILQGLVAVVAAPAIVKVASLMPCTPTEVIRAPEFLGGSYNPPLTTISMITREAVQLFRDSNPFIAMMDEQFDVAGEKIGSQLRIRLPNDYDGSRLLFQ